MLKTKMYPLLHCPRRGSRQKADISCSNTSNTLMVSGSCDLLQSGCSMVGQLWVFRLRLWHCAAIKELTLRFLLGAKKAWAPWLVRGSSVQFSRSVVSDSATLWTAGCQASLSVTNSWSPPKPMSIELVMPSTHLILSRPLLLLPTVFPSLRVFSNESALHIRRPKREPGGYIITATSRMNSVLVTQLKILDSSRFGVWVS